MCVNCPARVCTGMRFIMSYVYYAYDFVVRMQIDFVTCICVILAKNYVKKC